MTGASVNLTESQITTAVGNFLTQIVLAGTDIIVGQANLTPEPKSADFVIMWPTYRGRMAYNIDTWSGEDATVITAETDSRIILQLDVHGPQSAENAQIIATLWQDDYAAVFFDNAGYPLRPLYIDEGSQMPFENDQHQIETRWVMRAALQGNFTISTPQQFADTLAVGVISVDANYPPEP